MKKQSTTQTAESSVTWETLESWIRGHVQQFIQHVLEEEVTELLGRQKSVRRVGLDGSTAEWVWQTTAVNPRLRHDYGAASTGPRVR